MKKESLRDVFKRKYGDIISPENCGVSFGDGWYDIVCQCCDLVVRVNSELPPDARKIKVVQIKQKFGTLRFYVDYVPENWISSKINELQSLTRNICEDCGAPGKERDGSWIRTLCDSCSSKAKSNFVFETNPIDEDQ